MQKRHVGLITIGQSPREDIVPELTCMLPGSVRITESGALDGLSDAEIEKLAPRDDDYPLHTRLANGKAVTVGKRLIIPRIQTSVDRLDAEGVDVIALLCSGVFPAFRSRAPVLLPHAVIDQEIQSALGDRRRVAVLLPLSSQIEPTHRRFGGNELLALVPLPPDARTESVHDTALDLRRNDVDLVVLRCFSYPTALRDALAAQGLRRTILARAILADLLVTPPPGAKQI